MTVSSISKIREQLQAICNKTLNNIHRLAEVDSMVGKKEEVKRAIFKLEEDWDALSLRPLLLDTHCKLCPG